jgi:hypothetical protein
MQYNYMVLPALSIGFLVFQIYYLHILYVLTLLSFLEDERILDVWLQTEYGLVNKFIDHLNTPLRNTLYRSLTDQQKTQLARPLILLRDVTAYVLIRSLHSNCCTRHVMWHLLYCCVRTLPSNGRFSGSTVLVSWKVNVYYLNITQDTPDL